MNQGRQIRQARVSIGMPVYNGEAYIHDAITSLLQQTFYDFALIISDNASSDKTESICREYAQRDARVKYFRQPENLGAVSNFQFVLDLAQSDIFMWAAHDDEWAENYLNTAITLLDDRSIDFVFPSFWVKSIDLNTGQKFDGDIFRFIESTDRAQRVLHFTALHHDSHKCNIVYSLFRTEFLRSALKIQDISNDGVLGAVMLALGSGKVLGGELFRKRYPGLWPGALSNHNALVNNNHSEEFDLAKEAGLNRMTSLFPEYIDEIKAIFDRYHPYTYEKCYRICTIDGGLNRQGADNQTNDERLERQTLFIGMPVFNGEQYIEEAINSLRNQKFSGWKLLISDNASTDATSTICRRYTELDPRISYIQQSENIGAIANFEYLLTSADCALFMWAACDDVWEPDFLSSCVNRLDADKNIQMAFTGITNIDSYGRYIREYPDLFLLSGTPSVTTVSNFLCSPEVMGKANLIYSVYRTDFCKAIWSICPLSDVWGADMCFILAALSRGGIEIDQRVLFKKRHCRASDAPEKIDHICITNPFQHIFPHNEFDSYFGELLKAVAGTPFYGLAYTIMLMRRAGQDSMIHEVIKFIPEPPVSPTQMTTSAPNTNVDDFSHEMAQTFEADFARSWLNENFERLYGNIMKSIDDYQTYGDFLIGEGRGLYEFFQDDAKVWESFVNQVKDKTCLEIGSGPCGASCGWHFIRNWHVIDPLVADYKQMTLEMFGRTWWWDRLNLHPQNAELLLPDLIGRIDGVIVCRNALDHTDDPIQVLNNLAMYAVPGCKLLLWTDLYHTQGHDEGHRNICKSKDVFRTLITNRGFSIDYETPPFRQGETIEYGCVATKI